jgi:hypothetical protein
MSNDERFPRFKVSNKPVDSGVGPASFDGFNRTSPHASVYGNYDFVTYGHSLDLKPISFDVGNPWA